MQLSAAFLYFFRAPLGKDDCVAFVASNEEEGSAEILSCEDAIPYICTGYIYIYFELHLNYILTHLNYISNIYISVFLKIIKSRLYWGF